MCVCVLLSGSTMDNHEEILDALTAFGKNPNPQEIPSVLEQYLNSVAKNGETLFPWSQLKPLILRKMELVILELRRNLASENIPTRPNVENVRFDVIHARIIDSLHKFNGAPFTIQRLCELLIDPKRHYKRSDKFMRGLEKNVLVVSTVDPFGRKVVSELGSKPVLNGILDINGSYPLRDTALSVPLPPVPGWVNTAAANRNTATGASAVDSITKTGSNLDSLGKDSDGVVSNSLAVSGSQVFSDQGDPLAVQSEEVVEETVVTMDTGEVSSVVTDGGEALADREMEEDIGEDREASSFSSSSSSSSEELSTSSDSIENNLRSSTSPLDIPSNSLNDSVTTMDESRPWAAFAQDLKQQQDDLGTTSSSSSNLPVTEENQSGVSSSSPHNTFTADASSSSSLLSSSSSSASSETQSSLLSTSSTVASKVEGDQEEEEESRICSITSQQTTTSSDQSNWQQPSSDESSTADNNQIFGFDPSTSSQLVHDMIKTTTTTDKLISSSTSSVIPTTTTTTTIPDNNSNNTSSDVQTSSLLTSSESGVVLQPPTYAQVVASSTTDKMSLSAASSSSPASIQHISPYDSTTEPVPACDSVAGLERLVGSVEQTLSSPSSSSTLCPSSSSLSSSSSSSSPSPPSSSSNLSTLTTPNQNNSSAVTTSSLPESSLASMDSSCHTTPSSSLTRPSEEGEPVTKRPRLSMDEESMEEDCISTSGDSCIEQGQHTMEDELQQEHQEDSAPVHSSSVEGDEGLQQRETSEDVKMEEEEEGGVTTGTALTENDNANKESCDELELISSNTDNSDVCRSDADIEGDKDVNSNSESSTVSTTESDNKSTSQVDDKE